MTQERESKRTVVIIVGAITVIFILASWSMALWIIPTRYAGPTNVGEFGDMFGALNALFSGLALAGVIIAIVLQSRELELQRRELQETKAELKGQKIQMELQNTTLRLQAFENTFFQLLRLHNDAVDTVEIPWGAAVKVGKQSFPLFYQSLRDRFNEEEQEQDRLRLAYEHFWQIHRGRLEAYYKSLAGVFDCVLSGKSPDPQRYGEMVLSQLTDAELILIFYHGLSAHAKENLKEGIRNLSVLTGVPRDWLMSPEHENALDEGELHPDP